MQSLSISIRLDGRRLCKATFKLLQLDSGLGSGWATQQHDYKVTVSVSCLPASSHRPTERWTSIPVWGQECSGAGFHPGWLCTLGHSSFPLCWLVFQFLLMNSIHTAWCCLYHASLWGWYWPGKLLGHQTTEMCFFAFATPPCRPDWWIAAEMVVLLEGSLLSTEEG